MNKFRDLAGGFNVEPSSTFLWHHDATVPTMSITSTQGESGFYSADSSIDLIFTSSESTTTFTVDDIRTDGLGTISSFQEVSPTTYTAIFTPNDLTVEAKYIHVNAGWYEDAASNQNEASNTFVWNYDATRPTITISSDVVNAYVVFSNVGREFHHVYFFMCFNYVYHSHSYYHKKITGNSMFKCGLDCDVTRIPRARTQVHHIRNSKIDVQFQ